MLKHYLVDKNGMPLNVQTGVDGNRCLVTEGSRVLDAHWQSAAITTAVTTVMVTAKPDESIMLTDLVLVLSKKVASATIMVNFSDGTETINLFRFDANVDSFYFNHAFTGGLRGWKDANFDIITDEATTVSVLVGYVHISTEQTKTFSEWDAER